MGDDWLPAIYAEKVRSVRTRAVHLDVRKSHNQADIQHTLLGIELKVGKRRFGCPDLATARYLRVFARIGCPDFAIPYDISMISGIADELETSWNRSLLLLEEKSEYEVSTIERSALAKLMRDEVDGIGPGDTMPLFDRETKRTHP